MFPSKPLGDGAVKEAASGSECQPSRYGVQVGKHPSSVGEGAPCNVLARAKPRCDKTAYVTPWEHAGEVIKKPLNPEVCTAKVGCFDL